MARDGIGPDQPSRTFVMHAVRSNEAEAPVSYGPDDRICFAAFGVPPIKKLGSSCCDCAIHEGQLAFNATNVALDSAHLRGRNLRDTNLQTQPMMNQISAKPTKYMSIEYMRGLAAFFVAYGHLTYAFFDKNYLILDAGPKAANLLAIKVNDIPALWKIIPSSAVWVNLFFLISGFVIELSIQRIKPAGFLIQRFLRIYPVFWAGFAIQLIASLCILHKDIPSSAIYNFFLMNNSSFVNISWTLIFEINFYIFMFFIYFFKITLEIRLFIIQVVFWVFLILDVTQVYTSYNLTTFILANSFYISWMTIGTIFFYICNPANTEKERYYFYLLLAQSFMVFLQFSMLAFSQIGERMFPRSFAIYYSEAYGIFLTLILFDKYIGHIPPLRFLGKISYPLYCVHYSLGWGLHFLLIHYGGLSPLQSLCVVMPTVLLASWVIHKLIEIPSQHLGKRLTMTLRTASYPTPIQTNAEVKTSG